MTVLPLFFLLRGRTALTPQDAMDRRYQQEGPVGRSIYLTEHPCLWDITHDTCDEDDDFVDPHTQRCGEMMIDGDDESVLTMFACTVNLGNITKSIKHDVANYQLTPESLGRLGATAAFIQHVDEEGDVEDTVPTTRRALSRAAFPKRYFAMMDPQRVTDVIVWDASVPRNRLHRLPSETFFCVIPQTSSLLQRDSGDAFYGVRSIAVQDAASHFNTTTSRWMTRIATWTEVKVRMIDELQKWRRDSIFVPSFNVIVVRVALGVVRTVEAAERARDVGDDVIGDTVLRQLTPSECHDDISFPDTSPVLSDGALAPILSPFDVFSIRLAGMHRAKTLGEVIIRAPIDGFQLHHLDSWEDQLLPVVTSGSEGSGTNDKRASHNNNDAGDEMKLRCAQILPLTTSADRLTCDDSSKVLMMDPFTFLVMCHPTKGVPRETPVFQFVNNIFVVTKKRNSGHRLIERWGILSATTLLSAITNRTRAASAAKQTSVTLARAALAPIVNAAEVSPAPMVAAPSLEASVTGVSTAVTISTAPQPSSQQTTAAAPPPSSGVSGGSLRQLLIYWDIESLTPRNFVAQYKAFLRLLSLHDLYDKWNTHVQLHVYFDGGGWGQTSTFASFSDVATLVQGLLDTVQTTLHPIPTGRGAKTPTALSASGHQSATVDAMVANVVSALRRAHATTLLPGGLLSADDAGRSKVDAAVVVALLSGQTPQTLLESVLSPAWGGTVEGVVYCAGDSPPAATLQFLQRLQPVSRAHASHPSYRMLFLSADVVRFSFAALPHVGASVAASKAIAQPSNVSLSQESATRRRYVLSGPVPPERPTEITIAEVTLLGTSATSAGVDDATHPLAHKPYGWLLLPMMYCLWQLQQERGSVDVLLRDVFQVIKKTIVQPPVHHPTNLTSPSGPSSVVETEVLYSAFHALVSQGWLTPGYGKNFEGRLFPSAVCWTCFTSNMPKETDRDADDLQEDRSSSRNQYHLNTLSPSRYSFHETSHDVSVSAAWALTATKSPRTSLTTPLPHSTSFAWNHTAPSKISDSAAEGDDLLLLIEDELQRNNGQLGDVIEKATPGSLRPGSIQDRSPFGEDPFGAQQLLLPPLRESSTPSSAPAATSSATKIASGAVCVPLSNLPSSALEAFPMGRICVLGRQRQWMPPEIIAAQQDHRVDLLRVLVPLLTLQRQHGTRNVSDSALTDRCVVLEQMVLSMQGGLTHSAGTTPNLSYAARLAASGRSAIGRSTTGSRLDREKFLREIELAVSARALARLDDGTLSFVSDVYLSSATTSTVDLEYARFVVDDNSDSHRYRRSPPELSHVFTLQSLPRLLLIRALRDEQFVVYPMFAVRLRNVRQRWHELCLRHGLSLAVTAWDHARAQLERARMIYVFPTPQASQLTSMMFWSDAIAIATTTASTFGQKSLQSSVTLFSETHLVAQRKEEPYFCSHLNDAHRLCRQTAAVDGPSTLELSRDVFAREVQLLPRELSFAALQDSLNEQLLMILHALQKMQRAVIVDAVVCEYLVARFILQSPAGPGLMEQSNYQHTSPTAPSAPSRVSSMLGRHEQMSAAASVQSSVWSRLRESQHQLASFRLIYISGADIAFGSDYIFHIPHWASLRKVPRTNLLENDPVELQHDAAILDLGVKVFLETLMHMQRLLRRVRVPWGSLFRILEQHLSVSDGPLDVLGRCENAGLLHVEYIAQPPVGNSSAQHHQRHWSGPPPSYAPPVEGVHMQQGGHNTISTICFTSDVPVSYAVTTAAVAVDNIPVGTSEATLPLMPAPPPPAYHQPLPPAPPPLSRPLNPYSKPFVLEPQRSPQSQQILLSSVFCHPPIAGVGEGHLHAQLPSSVEMLKGLTAPAPPSPSRSQVPHSTAGGDNAPGEVVPLSALSHRRRVVQKKSGSGVGSSSSVLSQLFLTLERLEGKGVGGGGGEDDRTSEGTNSIRGGTPAIRDSTPAPATPTSATAPTGGAAGASSRFISALTWLFESALEDVSHGPKHNSKSQTDPATSKDHHPTTHDENSRRRKLYYSTLAAFFDTAANNREDGAAATTEEDGTHTAAGHDVEDEDEDDLVFLDASPSQKRRQVEQRSSTSVGGGEDATGNAGWQDGGIVVPSRNRPQLSLEQKRAIRQLHARLTQTGLMEGHQDAEPWESVSFFFAKAEVIAGLSL
jgi:hypothetical protein